MYFTLYLKIYRGGRVGWSSSHPPVIEILHSLRLTTVLSEHTIQGPYCSQVGTGQHLVTRASSLYQLTLDIQSLANA